MMKSLALRLFAVAIVAVLLGALPAAAQAVNTASTPLSLSVEAGFSAIHANAPPNGGCGCFYFYGGNGQVTVDTPGHISYVFDYNRTRASNINNLDHNITLSTYMGGARYSEHVKGLKLFGEALAGIAHTDSTYLLESNRAEFGALGGGGVDLRLSSRFDLRLAEVDYLYTRIPNGYNDHQNQIRYNAGVVFHFTKPE